jgi:hypothetical protein
MKKEKDTDKIKRRKPKNERKTIHKTMLFTEVEYAKVEKMLNELEINFSDFARASILKNKIKCTPKIKADLIFEINKIGNNLNQITKLANEKKAIDTNTLKVMFDIQKKLNELLS